ncbi:cadherin-24-like [Embiotoca jacksoni]|uniref:cadherin-24-like n=1 Tax=Embiotoca jacksoni TaxID=100190 RepID=UPI0037047202
MAAYVVLLFLLFCKGERNGISEAAGLSEEDQHSQIVSSKKQQVLPHEESTDNFFVQIKEFESQIQDIKGDVGALPNAAFQQNDGKRNAFDFMNKAAKQTVILKHPESSAIALTPKHSSELAVNHEKRSNLTNGEVEGVINDQSRVPSSVEEYALQPGLYLETGVGDVQPEKTRGLFKWVTESEQRRAGPYLPRAGLRSRRRRSWLWNQFFVIEEYRGPEPVLIGRLHTDMDRGDGRTKYILEGEGVGSVFVVDSNTGNIHVTKSLDREEKDQYRLVATATDRETGRALEPSSEFIIRVQDINDNPPVFPNEPYDAMVPEMANIGTSIVTVTARDADDPTYGNSARLVYAITQGQDVFSVDPQTGVLRTAVPDMDRETQDEYLVVLQAKDMGGHLGGLSGTTTVTVKLSDVNDNPPHFRRSSWSFSVSELAAPGVEVGRLTATDPDLGENAQLEFTVMDGEEAEIFNVTARDKEAVIVLNKLLDYETRSSYTFSVEVANPIVDPRYIRKGPFKDQATVRVMVLNADEPPRFSQALYHLDVSENCSPVCSVNRVSAVDPDTGQSTNIRYSIDPQSDPEALFRIASDTGFISTVMELDREQEQWHNITVIATQRDNPNLVSRVVVAIETLDQNDNAPELDRQYTTSVCDSSAPGQVVQVLRAIDRDQGGQDAPVHFSIPPESSSALNLTVRESGGMTASLVLQSALEPLPGFTSSLLTLYVPVVLRDGASGLTNTGTVTVTICPCLRGGMQTEDRGKQRDRRWERHTVCLPMPSASPSLIFSLVTLLAMLACVTTLLVVCALSLSLRHQKRDSHSPFEEDDVRENIISYDDEGGGEADTAAFDITALQSMHRIQHIHNNRNIWYTQPNPPRARTYSWSRHPRSGLDPQPRPGSAPLYGRLCYGIHTLPVLRDYPAGPLEAGLQLTQLTHGLTGGHFGNSLIIQNQSTFEPLLCSPEMSPGSFEAERMLVKTKITDRNESSEANAAGTTENQEQAKISPTESESKPASLAADLTYCDTNESSCQSHTSFSSNQQEGRPGSSQTQISTGATSCTVDDIDTDSSIPSLSERNYSNGSQVSCVNPPVYLKGDTYSIVGSLNPNSRGTCVNGTGSSGLYPGGVQVLNMCRLQRKDLTLQSLPLPGGMFGNNKGWPCGGEPAGTEAAIPQPLRMEELLNIRLDQVTFDLSQPPYDSLQTYEFEGRDSRAESLSSLESDGEKDDGKVVGGMEELNQKFQRLVEIIREREKEREKEKEKEREREKEREKEKEKEGQTRATEGGETADACLNETHKQSEDKDKEQQRWDF